MWIFPQRGNIFLNSYFVSNLDQMEKNYCPRRRKHFDNAAYVPPISGTRAPPYANSIRPHYSQRVGLLQTSMIGYTMKDT